MINDVKAEIEKRTGLPANVVDQVVNALGEIVTEKFPQYAGMIGPLLGIPTTQGGTTGAAGTTGTAGATGGQGLPDLGGWGSLLGGQGQPQQGTQGTGSQGGGTSGSNNPA